MISILFLGTGASAGIPSIANGWGNCDSTNFKNRRSRFSCYISDGESGILIDTPPEIRDQITSHIKEFKTFNYILYTHMHGDHMHGINDVRGLNQLSGRQIDAAMSEDTFGYIKDSFSYILYDKHKNNGDAFYKPCITPNLQSKFTVGKFTITRVEQNHNSINVSTYILHHSSGVKINLVTDYKDLYPDTIDMYSNPDIHISSCIGFKDHPSHVSVDRLKELCKAIKPKRTFLTHIGNHLDHNSFTSDINKTLISTFVAYDGLKIQL